MATVNGEDVEFVIDLSGLPEEAQRAVRRGIASDDDGWVSTVEHAKFDDWGDDDAASIARDLKALGYDDGDLTARASELRGEDPNG